MERCVKKRWTAGSLVIKSIGPVPEMTRWKTCQCAFDKGTYPNCPC
jgi:hypothetical protein